MNKTRTLLAASLFAFISTSCFAADFSELKDLDPETKSILDDSGITPEWVKISANLEQTNFWLVNKATITADPNLQWVGAWTKMSTPSAESTQQETYIIWDCKYSNVGFVAIKDVDPDTGKTVVLKDDDVVWAPYFKSDTTIMALGANNICEAFKEVLSGK